MIVSFLTLVIGNNQGMGDIEHGKMHRYSMCHRALSSCSTARPRTSPTCGASSVVPCQNGGYIAGTIIKPKLGLRPEPFAAAAYQFWLGGDFIKNDEPQGNQVFCPAKKVYPAGL